MDIRRIRTLARRVIFQMRNDPRTIGLMALVPCILLTFVSILIRAEPGKMEVAVVHNSSDESAIDSRLSARLAEVLGGFDELETQTLTAEEASQKLADGELEAALTVSVRQANPAPEIVLHTDYEGSNPMVAERLDKVLERATLQTLNSLFSESSAGSGTPPVTLTTASTYRHGGAHYDTLDYMAPALIGFFVFFLVFILTCIAFLRERVAGTLERLQATPIRPHEIILGYMLGFMVFGLLQGALTLLFTVFVLDIHYAGNLLSIFVVEILLVMVSVNLGIFLSTFAQNEFQVLQFIPLVVVTQGLLGGIVWQIDDMPAWLQPVAKLMPLTYANRALRDVMIKGDALGDVGGSLLVLFLFAMAAVLLSARTAGRVRI